MWIPPIGEALRDWFAKFGNKGDGSSEEAVIEDFSALDIRLKEYDARFVARVLEQQEIEARLQRLETQSRRDY